MAADGSMQTARLAARQRREAQPERKRRRWRRRSWSRQSRQPCCPILPAAPSHHEAGVQKCKSREGKEEKPLGDGMKRDQKSCGGNIKQGEPAYGKKIISLLSPKHSLAGELSLGNSSPLYSSKARSSTGLKSWSNSFFNK